MTIYKVMLGSLYNKKEKITLASEATEADARHKMKQWRKVLGNKNWNIDRRPGLDTLDHLTLTVVKELTIDSGE